MENMLVPKKLKSKDLTRYQPRATKRQWDTLIAPLKSLSDWGHASPVPPKDVRMAGDVQFGIWASSLERNAQLQS